MSSDSLAIFRKSMGNELGALAEEHYRHECVPPMPIPKSCYHLYTDQSPQPQRLRPLGPAISSLAPLNPHNHRLGTRLLLGSLRCHPSPPQPYHHVQCLPRHRKARLCAVRQRPYREPARPYSHVEAINLWRHCNLHTLRPWWLVRWRRDWIVDGIFECGQCDQEGSRGQEED